MTLVSSTITGYQWYQGGVIIKGANSPKYSPNDIDVYTVQVTSSVCKSQMSDEFIYTANTLVQKAVKQHLLWVSYGQAPYYTLTLWQI